MLLRKLISGGRQGVERGAIDAAKALGFPCGGLKSKGRCVNGDTTQSRSEGMAGSRRRKEDFHIAWNVLHSDATLIFLQSHQMGDAWFARINEGSLLAGRCCSRRKLPCRIEMSGDAEATYRWIKDNVAKSCSERGRGFVLNVTGPSESEEPGVQSQADLFVRRLISLDGLPHMFSAR